MRHLRNEIVQVKVFQAKITTILSGGSVYQNEVKEIVIEAKRFANGDIEEFQINRKIYVPVRMLEKRAKPFLSTIQPGEETTDLNLRKIQSLISVEEK